MPSLHCFNDTAIRTGCAHYLFSASIKHKRCACANRNHFAAIFLNKFNFRRGNKIDRDWIGFVRRWNCFSNEVGSGIETVVIIETSSASYMSFGCGERTHRTSHNFILSSIMVFLVDGKSKVNRDE